MGLLTADLLQLLENLAGRGIRLEAEGDRLECRGPAGALTPDLRETVRAHRQDLLALLADPGRAARGIWKVAVDEVSAVYVAAAKRPVEDTGEGSGSIPRRTADSTTRSGGRSSTWRQEMSTSRSSPPFSARRERVSTPESSRGFFVGLHRRSRRSAGTFRVKSKSFGPRRQGKCRIDVFPTSSPISSTVVSTSC